MPVLCAEDGLVYIGDINRDGVLDKIVSGPSGMFGAQGQNGPFILTLSMNGNNKDISIGGSGDWVIERSKEWIRLWSYAHSSSTSGNIGYYEISLWDGTRKSGGSLSISTGDGGTDLGNGIYSSVFNEKNEHISCKIVHDYVPPKFDVDGKEWGK